jgi:hypothetical protein
MNAALNQERMNPMRAIFPFAVLLTVVVGLTAQGANLTADEAPAPPEGWVDYTPKDKIFSVFIPKGGKRTERTDTVQVKDQKIRVNIIELESDGKGQFIALSLLLQPKLAVPKRAPVPPVVPVVPPVPIGPIGKGPVRPVPPVPPVKPVRPGPIKPLDPPSVKPIERVDSGPADAQAMTEIMRDVFLKHVKGKVADEKDIKLGEYSGKEYQVTIDSKTSARCRVFVAGTLIQQFAIVGTKEQVEGKDADLFLDSFRMPK